MDEKIQSVKINFNKIKEIRTQVMYCFNALEIKITKLKTTTSEFIRTNKDTIFVFGLDSFQFQGKLIDYEYNDMQKFYFALNNRLYCEYYKLYKLILQYTEEIIGTNKNIEMLKSNTLFPIYKDLEPFKQYNFETIEEIHKTIVNLLNNLNEHIITKETQLQTFQLKQLTGLNINNFVNTFDFDVIVIKQKCLLYLSYLEFFHNIHTKHFKRFSKKIKLMNDYLDEDIKFDEGIRNRENDSIKSSASTSSFDSIDSSNFIPINSPINSDEFVGSLFKTNVNNVNNVNNENNENNVNNENNEYLHNAIIDEIVEKHIDIINEESNAILLETISDTISDTINVLSVEKFEENVDTVCESEIDEENDTDDKINNDLTTSTSAIIASATITAETTDKIAAKRKRKKKK
jgi:hypothetical protein